MLDILDRFKEALIELIRDYKSRKFVVTILVIGIIVANKAYTIGLSEKELMFVMIVAGAYVLIEGIADIIDRYISPRE